MPSLKSKLKQAVVNPEPQHTTPLWQGPSGKGPQGGVTQGLIARWLQCPERARLYLMEGWRPVEQFSHRMEYGNYWHKCEEALASGFALPGIALTDYAKLLCRKYPLQQEQIIHWMNVCRVQFPCYVQYWAKHPDVENRIPLLAEQTFDVPYPLPSGRVSRLRGKWDSVDLVGKGKTAAIWLQENKTKGDIDEPQLKRQLSSGFQLQTMLYLVALANFEVPRGGSVMSQLRRNDTAGVRYNIVRRPLSGGRHSIKQKQGQTAEEFYTELGERIAREPEFFFMRWNVGISAADIARFRRECLDPVLESMYDDWEWWSWMEPRQSRRGNEHMNLYNDFARHRQFPKHVHRHFRMPYIGYSNLLDGGEDGLDHLLNEGSKVGLEQVNNLFPELNSA